MTDHSDLNNSYLRLSADPLISHYFQQEPATLESVSSLLIAYGRISFSYSKDWQTNLHDYKLAVCILRLHNTEVFDLPITTSGETLLLAALKCLLVLSQKLENESQQGLATFTQFLNN